MNNTICVGPKDIRVTGGRGRLGFHGLTSLLIALMVGTGCQPADNSCDPREQIRAYRAALGSLDEEQLKEREHFLVAQCVGVKAACVGRNPIGEAEYSFDDSSVQERGVLPSIATRGQLWYEMLIDEPETMAQKLRSADRAAIHAFIRAQPRDYFSEHEGFNGRGVVATEAELAATYERAGWEGIWREHPGTSGVVRFWPAGFNESCDQAIVYVTLQRGLRIAKGWIVVLRKERGRWEVVERQQVWSA